MKKPLEDWAVYRANDLMEVFGCSRRTIGRWISDKKLPGFREFPGGPGWFGQDLKQHFDNLS